MANASSMHEVGSSKQVLWDNPDGRVGREVGGGQDVGGACVPMADFLADVVAPATTVL